MRKRNQYSSPKLRSFYPLSQIDTWQSSVPKILSIFLTLTLVLVGCTVSPTAVPSPTPSAAPTLTLIPTLTSTPDEKVLFRKYLDTEVENFKVDVSCQPICWNGFIPGKTAFPDVVSWLGTTTSSPNYPTTQGNPNAAENSTGFSSEMAIEAFSDATQPLPLLRAYDVQFDLPLRTSEPTTGVDPRTDSLLPQNLLLHSPQPSMVISGEISPSFYYALLDFKGWAVQYRISADPAVTATEVCLRHVSTIYVWVYNSGESDAFTMIQALGKYKNVSGTISDVIVPAPENTLKVTDPDKIKTLLTRIKESNCIPLK